MNAWSFLAVFAVVSLSSCGISPEKEAVVEKARSIREFPVSRATLITSLGLEGASGESLEGPISTCWATSFERWKHPSGLTITAHDYHFLKPIDRKTVNEALDSRPRTPIDFIGQPTGGKPSEAFDSFIVRDGRKILFQSDQSSNDSPDVQ